jgi:hypothetical protein
VELFGEVRKIMVMGVVREFVVFYSDDPNGRSKRPAAG